MSYESDPINGPRLPQGAVAESSAYVVELSKLQTERDRLLDDITNSPSIRKRDEAKKKLEIVKQKIGVLQRLHEQRLYEQQRKSVAAALQKPPVVLSKKLQQEQMEAAIKKNKDDYDALPPGEKLMYRGPKK